MITTEQITAARQAQLDTLFGLSQTALDSVEKLVTLHMQIARRSIDEASALALSSFDVKDAQGFVAALQPNGEKFAEKLSGYGREVYDIQAAAGAEVVKAVEAQTADAQKAMLSAIDAAAKNAPAGSENALALVKTTFAAANDAYETANRAAKQAAGIAEANMKALASSATSTAVTVAKAAPKAKRSA